MCFWVEKGEKRGYNVKNWKYHMDRKGDKTWITLSF